jgi:hypothetical protein
MNCEDFNQIINELADYKPMQTTIRDAGVSHVALCPECAAKLANARAIGGCLLLAARAESEEAPARIKESLLAAFADRRPAESTPARVVEVSVVDISSRRRNPRRWMAAAAAVAAVILLAVLVPIWRKAFAPPSPQPANELQAGAHGPSATPGIVDKTPVAPVNEGTPDDTARPPVKTRPRVLRHRTPESRSPRQAYESVAQNTGEYLPLTYLAKATAMDSGMIVRVELSRSALASLGFQVNVGSAGESVKADVILGDDGVARAIRLVQ